MMEQTFGVDVYLDCPIGEWMGRFELAEWQVVGWRKSADMNRWYRTVGSAAAVVRGHGDWYVTHSDSGWPLAGGVSRSRDLRECFLLAEASLQHHRWMRALTVRHPWAWAIAHLGKDVENRPMAPPKWVGRHGARIAIHASVGTTMRQIRDVQSSLAQAGWPAAKAVGRDFDRIMASRGCIIATARVSKATEPVASQWAFPGQQHWMMSDVVVLPEPMPATGMLGLWRLPADLDAAVRDVTAQGGLQ